MISLSFGLEFDDLYSSNGLKKLDNCFLNWLKNDFCQLPNSSLSRFHSIDFAEIIERKRKEKEELNSEEIIDIAILTELFLSKLFQIENQLHNNKEKIANLKVIFKCRKVFIQKRVISKKDLTSADLASSLDILQKHGLSDYQNTLNFAKSVLAWLNDDNEEAIAAAQNYANYRVHQPSNDFNFDEFSKILFSIPKKLDFANLITDLDRKNDLLFYDQDKLRNRSNFSLNDQEKNLANSQKNAFYCIYCHTRKKDSCSHGIFDSTSQSIKKNPLNISLDGCPLREKISEMNLLRANNYIIAPLVTATLDNPMIAATGHRICNDCMKSCIYQKQEPVNIPMIESQLLDDVLSLPWGFEIYSLLTRWNPLNTINNLPKAVGDKKVLIVGMGPAGFTLAHYLLNQGIIVVAIDGSKIEPLSNLDKDDVLVRDWHNSLENFDQEINFSPIKDIKKLFLNLDLRQPQGFGGVMEYGITVRWNKNYLTLIRLLLQRRNHFQLYDGVRFGSQIDFAKAKELGFSHVALATGAGKPSLPSIANVMIRGVRTASDFLMSLQLSGAFHQKSNTNLQIRMPILIIGAGLTAIDTATESLIYYLRQVENFYQNYQQFGDKIYQGLNEEELAIAKEFISHGRELSQIKKRGESIVNLLRKWGGATILYRNTIVNSSAYRINHEEMKNAFAEGIYFIEKADIIAIERDKYDHCSGVYYHNPNKKNTFLPGKTIFIAIGTSPNTVVVKELSEQWQSKIDDKGYFTLQDHKSFIVQSETKNIVGISIFGDLHPYYHGNVVKAMASAKLGHKEIIADLEQKDKNHLISLEHKNSDKNKIFDKKEDDNFIKLFFKLNENCHAFIKKINILTKTIVEIVVKAPFASNSFQPGQFFRLQNYSTSKVPLIEALALTGAKCSKGYVSLIVLETGGSSNLCRHLSIGEKVILMGPTGRGTEISKNENVILIGGGLGNAVLFSIGEQLKKNNCKVLYFAGYKKLDDLYKREEIENSSDQVFWSCENGLIQSRRDQDFTIRGNIIDGLNYYKNKLAQNWPNCLFRFQDVNRIIVIGSPGLMKVVTKWRYHGDGKSILSKNCRLIGSINSPMQCMMKEICAQCLQRKVDKDGKESYVYSCYDQDQECQYVDFDFLQQRLRQNSLLEKIASLNLAANGY